MPEILQIIYYNLLILVFALAIGYVYLKWKHKKRIDHMLAEMEKDYYRYADFKALERQKRLMAEYNKKHPFKALKRKIKEKTKWLF